MSTYIRNDQYNAAMNAIAALEPCPMSGKIEPDQIKTILGEHLDIWPASIAPADEAALRKSPDTTPATRISTFRAKF